MLYAICYMLIAICYMLYAICYMLLLGLIQKRLNSLNFYWGTRSHRRLVPRVRKQTHSSKIEKGTKSQKITLASWFIQARRRYTDDQARPNITVESRSNLQIYNSVKRYYYFNVVVRFNKFTHWRNKFTDPEHPEGSLNFKPWVEDGPKSSKIRMPPDSQLFYWTKKGYGCKINGNKL